MPGLRTIRLCYHSRPMQPTEDAHEDPEASAKNEPVPGLVGERLRMAAFHQLASNLAGYPYVKIVVDRPRSTIHFLNGNVYQFHADYIAERLMGMRSAQLQQNIDAFNHSVYVDPDRQYYLAILAFHRRVDRKFFSLETVEVDTMNAEMVTFLYRFVRGHLDPAMPLLLKPANHLQETIVASVDPSILPRVYAHELFSSATYVPLNPGTAKGRLRAFHSEEAYRENRLTLEWHDIVVMERVPDDIPRLSGIINAAHTTPLSHTNVLASGWQVPNCIQLGILDRIKEEGLDGNWVEYAVAAQGQSVGLTKIERPPEADQRPAWRVHKIQLDEPETMNVPIVSLDQLRHDDRHRYGTKAANLGELAHVMRHGSERLLGYYKVKRPPRANLLPYLASHLGAPETAEATELGPMAWEFLKQTVEIPGGIAIPFSIQQEFLESSPKIQQALGKLKMALELNARQVESLCVTLQQMIRSTRFPERTKNYIDDRIASSMSGVKSFVVRSSSNAEDLENFSAAGIYESINHVTSAEKLFESIKQVWASLLSPRSVRLRQEVGISLDDCYMGVVVQEEVPSTMGGVMVTTNPMSRTDFRNVYLNVSTQSVQDVVQGTDLPYQYLYNTVEGGGRTLSIGQARADLSDETRQRLQKLAIVGRLLQSHFAPDYTYSQPVDIEWLAGDEKFYVLQSRPYAH